MFRTPTKYVDVDSVLTVVTKERTSTTAYPIGEEVKFQRKVIPNIGPTPFSLINDISRTEPSKPINFYSNPFKETNPKEKKFRGDNILWIE